MTTNAKAQASQLLLEQEAAKKRAARQAATIVIEIKPPEMVECTVLPMGDGKISMGIHVPGIGEAHYEEEETFSATIETAEALKARGFVNFKAAAKTVVAQA